MNVRKLRPAPYSTALVSTKGATDEEGQRRKEGQREGADSAVALSSGSRVKEDQVEREKFSAVKRTSSLSKLLYSSCSLLNAGAHLEDLPNEILSEIASLVFIPYTRSSKDLRPFTADKRLYSVGLSAWCSEYYSLKLANIPFRLNLHHLIKGVVAQFDSGLAIFAYQSIIVSLFRNLVELHLNCWFGGGPETVTLPASFTRMLRCLDYLEDLCLHFSERIEWPDEAFSIGRDLPRLKQLGLGINRSALHQLFKDPCSLVQLGLHEPDSSLLERKVKYAEV
ncbi:hypothetical protein JCM8547_002991 [Rhodosporidiobolus lusitaniae]